MIMYIMYSLSIAAGGSGDDENDKTILIVVVVVSIIVIVIILLIVFLYIKYKELLCGPYNAGTFYTDLVVSLLFVLLGVYFPTTDL